MLPRIERRLRKIEKQFEELVKPKLEPYEYFVESDGQPTSHLKDLRTILSLKEAFIRIERVDSPDMERRESGATSDGGGDLSDDGPEIDRDDPAYTRKKKQEYNNNIDKEKKIIEKRNKSILESREKIENKKGKPKYFIKHISYFPDPSKSALYGLFEIGLPKENRYKKEDHPIIRYLIPIYADGSLGDHYLYPVDGPF